MKKSLLTFGLAIISLGAMAQIDESFSFCDKDGNAIANGTTINVTEGEYDDIMEQTVMHSGVYVCYNVSGFAGMRVEISRMDNGTLQHCFPDQCVMKFNTCEFITTPQSGKRAGTIESLNSEWLAEGEGLTTVSYTLLKFVRNDDGTSYELVGEGATITVNYCNGVYPDRIESVGSSVADSKTYNLIGQEVRSDNHGVIIRNGKKVIQ